MYVDVYMYVNMRVCERTCACIYPYITCMHVSVYMCMYMCMSMHVNVCACAHVYMCVGAYMCAYVLFMCTHYPCVYVCMRVCTYAHASHLHSMTLGHSAESVAPTSRISEHAQTHDNMSSHGAIIHVFPGETNASSPRHTASRMPRAEG